MCFMGCQSPISSLLKWSRRWQNDPLIFAMANPDPEIKYELAKEARPDAIVATGRSDYPNQINNVLGFPFIFRGALDVRARAINEEMKVAASQALAALTKEDVPDSVLTGVWSGFAEVWSRLHHPQAARSTCAVVGEPGGGANSHGNWCGAQADRPGRVSPAAGIPPGDGRTGTLLHYE